MKLHCKVLGKGEPLMILHGLFGSSDNWRTLGKRFAEHYRVLFVDLRNHGHSPKSDEFNYPVMVRDLAELCMDLNLTKFSVIGHSMGGKAAIAFAAMYPDKIQQLVVSDIGHKAYEHHHDHILEGLHALNLHGLTSRADAEEVLSKYVNEPGVRQLLLKNLYWEKPGQLGWRINIPVISREIGRIIEEIKFDHIDCDTLFIRGGKSSYITDADIPDIKRKFPNSEMVTVREAGHWIHADAPDEFFNSVMQFFTK